MDVGAISGFGVETVHDGVGGTGRKDGVVAVEIGDDTPELGTAFVGSPEADIVAIGGVGASEIEAVAVGVGDGVSVGSGVIGKGPILCGGAIGAPELDVGAGGRFVVKEVDDFLRVDGGGDGIGAIGEGVASIEVPFLGGGVVGAPELNIGAESALGVKNIKSHPSVAGGEEGIGAVVIADDLPAFGAGVVLFPELDVGTLSGIGAGEVKIAARDDMAEGVKARGFARDVPLVGGSVGSGGQVDIGGVFDAVRAETDVIREGGGELVDTVGEVGGDGVSGQWVRLGWDLSATEPVGEVEEEVAVAIGRAGVARTVAGGKGGGVGLVGGVAIERGSGTVLNINR